MTKKEMRMYEIETSRKTLAKLLRGEPLKNYTRILADLALSLENEEPEPCEAGERGDVYFMAGNIETLAFICLPVMAEIELDEDGEDIGVINCDYPEDIFPEEKLEWLKNELF